MSKSNRTGPSNSTSGTVTTSPRRSPTRTARSSATNRTARSSEPNRPSVVKTNNTLDISFGLVSLYGAGSVSGTSTEVVNTQVFAFDRQDYQGFPANAVIWVNHTSRYGLSWYRFLNQTLANALGLGGTFTQTPLDISYIGKTGLGAVVYLVSARYNPSAQTYTMRLEIHNSALLALSVFRLQHAQVQVGVGDTTPNVQF